MINSLIVISLFCIIIYFRNSKNLSLEKTIIFSLSLTAFYFPIGPTINLFFLFSIYLILEFLINEIFKIKINNNILLLTILPFISFSLFSINYIVSPSIDIHTSEILNIIINPIYFYIKTYFPWLVIFWLVYNCPTKDHC